MLKYLSQKSNAFKSNSPSFQAFEFWLSRLFDLLACEIRKLIGSESLKKHKNSVALKIIFISFATPQSYFLIVKLSDGVIGNTSVFGTEESRFET